MANVAVAYGMSFLVMSAIDNGVQFQSDPLRALIGFLASPLALHAIVGPTLIPVTAAMFAVWASGTQSRVRIFATSLVVYLAVAIVVGFLTWIRVPAWPTLSGYQLTVDWYVLGIPFVLGALVQPPSRRDA